MADRTTRFGIHKPTGGDPAAVPADVGRALDQLTAIVVGYDLGTLASRPAPGVGGRFYYATDDGTLYYDTSSGSSPGTWVPAAWQPGDVRWSASKDEPPLGWLRANGDVVEQARYQVLFARIGHAYGSPSATHFTLPDLRGRSAIGEGTGAGLTARALGSRVGAETHPLLESEMPRHKHVVSDPGHLHGNGETGDGAANRPYPMWGQWFPGEANSTYPNGPYTSVRSFGGAHDGLHRHGIARGWTGISLAATGGTPWATVAPHNNIQPSLVLQAWVKT